jgi:hypothetical protein
MLDAACTPPLPPCSRGVPCAAYGCSALGGCCVYAVREMRMVPRNARAQREQCGRGQSPCRLRVVCAVRVRALCVCCGTDTGLGQWPLAKSCS